jgi:hypothetical protein
MIGDLQTGDESLRRGALDTHPATNLIQWRSDGPRHSASSGGEGRTGVCARALVDERELADPVARTADRPIGSCRELSQVTTQRHQRPPYQGVAIAASAIEAPSAGVGLFRSSATPLQTIRLVAVQAIWLDSLELSGDDPALNVLQLSLRGL